MGEFLNPEFWSQRYKEGTTGWDLGVVSPPIKAYIEQLTNKDLKILIPGCGNAHEGEYLRALGFQNVHLLDYAPEALQEFSERNPDFPKDQLHIGDFFEHRGEYDLIIEQTLFCAIDPQLREKYAQHSSELLKPGGKLVGLLFNRDFDSGPPFGGSQVEYEAYFQKYFSKIEMSPCVNSISPRAGTELFIKLTK